MTKAESSTYRENGRPGPVIKPARKELVEWAVKSGAWNHLPPRQGMVLTLRYNDVNPLTCTQAGEVLGISNPAVVVTEREAMRSLAKAREKVLFFRDAQKTGAIAALTDPQKEAMQKMYGGRRILSREQVAKKLHTTKNGIRQRENQAWTRLREAGL